METTTTTSDKPEIVDSTFHESVSFMVKMEEKIIELELVKKLLLQKIEDLESELVIAKIDKQAIDNANRKLNEANSRIVEFDDIKKSHLKIQEQQNKEIEKLKKELSFSQSESLILLGKFTKSDREKYEVQLPDISTIPDNR